MCVCFYWRGERDEGRHKGWRKTQRFVEDTMATKLDLSLQLSIMQSCRGPNPPQKFPRISPPALIKVASIFLDTPPLILGPVLTKSWRSTVDANSGSLGKATAPDNWGP